MTPSEFLAIIASGNGRRIRQALAEGAPVNVCVEGVTPLSRLFRRCEQQSHPQALQALLLDYGADPCLPAQPQAPLAMALSSFVGHRHLPVAYFLAMSMEKIDGQYQLNQRAALLMKQRAFPPANADYHLERAHAIRQLVDRGMRYEDIYGLEKEYSLEHMAQQLDIRDRAMVRLPLPILSDLKLLIARYLTGADGLQLARVNRATASAAYPYWQAHLEATSGNSALSVISAAPETVDTADKAWTQRETVQGRLVSCVTMMWRE